jgi:hypothetical protein
VKCSRTKRRAPRGMERAWPSLLEYHVPPARLGDLLHTYRTIG